MNMKSTIEVNEAKFETEVLKSSQPVLVEFATRWSFPSMTLDGVLEEGSSDQRNLRRSKLICSSQKD